MKEALIATVVLLAVVAGPTVARGEVAAFETRTAVTAFTPIDELVFGRLQRLGITPAYVCSDAVFVRRAFLDVIGTLPTPEETRAFLDDASAGKRGALIDRLLERDEFADYWAMKWCDLLRVKSEFPINLWPNAVQGYHRWIRTGLKQNVPYDRFVRELLTASGSNFRVPPVNFYRAVQTKEPQGLAQAVALTFMGTRADQWPKDRLAGLAAFFAQLDYKSTAEWKEEIVFFNPGKTNTPAPGAVVRPATFPDGTAPRLAPDQDPREALAAWLVKPKNPWFTRAIVNRVWAWLLGRGIVHEPDDQRADNPPSNPELLAYLERELIAAHYDLRHLYRLILKSRVYQLSCIPRSADRRAEAQFAYYALRPLEAEVLIDALDQITGATENYYSPIPEPYSVIPEGQRSIGLADASVTSSFLELFGRSPRDTGLESERNTRPTAGQRLYLLNSSAIQRKLEQSAQLRPLWQTPTAPHQLINRLYLTILSRPPTDDEQRIAADYLRPVGTSGGPPRRTPAVDVAWALINSPEFLYRH